jgi:hypothetical protein
MLLVPLFCPVADLVRRRRHHQHHREIASHFSFLLLY